MIKRRASDNQLLSDIIVALCRDYDRRSAAIATRSSTRRVLMEYKYINTRIFDAAAEIVGSKNAETMIREIGWRIGYASSDLYTMSEGAYKNAKLGVKDNIAVKLYLKDDDCFR